MPGYEELVKKLKSTKVENKTSTNTTKNNTLSAAGKTAAESAKTQKLRNISNGTSYSDYVNKLKAQRLTESNIKSEADVSKWYSDTYSAISDMASYNKNNANKYVNEYGGNAAKRVKELLNSYYDVSDYLSSHKDSYENYDKIREEITALRTSLNQFDDFNNNTREYYSQWENEEAYNTEMAEYEKYLEEQAKIDAMSTLDLDAEYKDLEEKKKQFEEYDKARKDLEYLGTLTPNQIRNNYAAQSIENRKRDAQNILNKYKDIDMDALEYEINQQEIYLGKAQKLQSSQKTTLETMKQDDFEKFSKVAKENATSTFGINTPWGRIADNGDRRYDYINDLGYAQTLYPDDTEGLEKYSTMTEDEVAVYNYLYNKEGKESADKYLDDLDNTLNERYMEKYKERWEEFATKLPAFSSALSVSANIIGGGLGYLDVASQHIANAFTGEDKPIDYNRGAMRASVMSSTVRGTVSKNIADATGIINLDEKEHPVLSKLLNGKSLGDVYQLAMSMADSGTIAIVSKLTGLSPIFGTMLLGGSAATQGLLDALERGATDEEAFIMGTLNGVFEALFEKYSIENLLNGNTRNIVKAFLKQGAVEGSEEVFTSFANNIADILVMAEKSGYRKNVEAYVEAGMSREQANTQALLDTAVDLGWDFIGGFFSGGIMGSVNTAIGNHQTKTLYGDNDSTAILDEALEIDPEDEYAKKLKERVDGGKKLRAEHYATLVDKNSEKLHQQDEKAIKDAVKEKLTAYGETGNIEALSEILLKQAKGVRLNIYDKSLLANSKYGQRVSNELNIENIKKGGYNTEWAENIGTNSINPDFYNRVVEDVETEEAPEGKSIEDVLYKRPKGANEVLVKYAAENKLNKKTADFENRLEEKAESNKKIEALNVSDDGKTIHADEEVEIEEVASVKGGKMVLRLANGKNVSADSISYPSGDDAVLYGTVQELATNSSQANEIINGFKNSGLNVSTYTKGVRLAHLYGTLGLPLAEIEKSGSASKLPLKVRNAAYKAGMVKSGKDVAKATAIARKALKTARGTTRNGGVFFGLDSNNVSNIRDYIKSEGKTLNATQEAGIVAMEMMSKALGVEYYVFESYLNKDGKRVYIDENGNEVPAPNGYYENNKVYIDLNAGAKGEGLMLYTVAHEMTHFIRKWSPAKFKVLANAVIEHSARRGQSIEDLVDNQIAKAERDNRTIDEDEALEEVIADSMETILADGKVLEMMTSIKQKDESLWSKIKEWFKDLANKLKSIVSAYEGATPDSYEGKMVANMKDIIGQLEKIYAEGLVEASGNYSAATLTPGVEGTTYTADGEPIAHVTADGTMQLSMRTYEEEGRAEFRKYLQKCVTNKSLTKAEMQEMLDGIEEIYNVCKEFKDQYAPFSSWSDAAVVRDTRGKPVFSVVTTNGEYKMNLDFSLVCKKRRTLDAVFNEMSRRGIIDDFELGQKSVVKINEIIRSYGLETACALCFVDAKRFRRASMADSFTNLYNDLVLSLVPENQQNEVDYFNFSNYSTIRKVDDGIHTWKNSELDFSHINEVLKNYGSGTVEYKAAKHIKNHPADRKLLLRGDFMSSQGFDAVKTQNANILKLYNSKKGTGGPKAAFGDVQYMNEIIQKARWWTPEKAYSVGGVRIQSFSDYVPRMVFDYTQMIYDLAATKLPAHAYTKEALFVKQFGLTGIKINMSLIPEIAKGGIAPGLDANGDYVWAGESFDYNTATEIQNAEGYTENCGTICVGVSHDHIVKLLRDPNIRMVIPYHKSGLNPIVAHMNKIAEFHDYTNDQRTKGKDGTALEKDFDFSKALHDMGANASPKAVADQYLKWCVANGYTAKFAEFATEDNYYKLLEDFTLYDKDGNYVPQREVRAVFPKEDSPFGSMKQLIKEGLEEDAIVEGKRDERLGKIVDEIEATLPKTEAEITEEQVEQADRDLEAEEDTANAMQLEDGSKYSTRDTLTDDEVLKRAAEGVKIDNLTEAEKDALDIFKKRLAKVEKLKAERVELGKEFGAGAFTKGALSTERRALLLEGIKDADKRIEKAQADLFKVKKSKVLTDVLHKARKVIEAEERSRVKETLYKKFDKKEQNIRDTYEERISREKDSAQKRAIKQKIRRTIMDLNKLLNRGDKKKNVKEEMKGLVSEALRSYDILYIDAKDIKNEDLLRAGIGTQLTSEERKNVDDATAMLKQIYSSTIGADTDELVKKFRRTMAKLSDVFVRERTRVSETKVSEVLSELADSYKELEESQNEYVRDGYHEVVHQFLEYLKKEVGGTLIRDMSANQLEELYQAYKMVLTTVRNANNLFAENLKESREVLANRTLDEVNAMEKHGLWGKVGDAVSRYAWNNLKPIYAFEKIGSNTLTTLYKNVRDGQNVWAKDFRDADNFRKAVEQKYNFNSWDMDKTYTFTSSSGTQFDLSLQQIMSLYAYSKREQAFEHLLKGGIVFESGTEVVVKKNGIKMTYLNKNATAHQISFDVLKEIISDKYINKEQKAYVDEMQGYLSSTMGSKGNEVTMKLYGVELFGEKNYFPLRSAGQYMAKAKETDLKKEQGQVSLINAGFSKKITPKANNPVVLSNFNEVWSGHVNDMSMYHAFVLPLEDFRKVYEYKTPNVEGETPLSINSALQNVFGDSATKYIDQLIKDINGGVLVDPRESIGKNLISKFKKAAVMGSASVVIQQPSAIGRAFAEINPKYFLGERLTTRNHKEVWEEVKKYSPVAFIKEMGYFDVGMGKGPTDYLMTKEYDGVKDKAKALIKDKEYRGKKLDDAFGKLPALADEFTWCAIWNAVKREVKDNNPNLAVNSEEFLNKCGERFTDIIDKTQVYDSVFSRSANMRSKSVYMNMLTSFMAEPTTSINMLSNAIDKIKKGDKETAIKTIASVYTSLLLNSMLVSLVYAARDDDEDETFLEKYISSFSTEMVDGINPITYLPFIKDMWSVMQGYDVERADMSLVSDLTSKMTNLIKLWSTDTSEMSEDSLKTHNEKLTEAYWSVLDYTAALLGLPMKNIRRDINGAFNLTKTLGEDLGGRETSWGSLMDKTWDDIKKSIPVIGWTPNEKKTDKLYKAIINGDTVYANRIKGSYDTESALQSAMKKALQDNDPRVIEAAVASYEGDNATLGRLVKEIIGEGNFSQQIVMKAINSEENKLEPDDNDGSSSSKKLGIYDMDNFAKSVIKGDSVTSRIKEDIINTKVKNGSTREDAEKSFISSAKTMLKDLYLEGEINEAKVLSTLTKYCDMDIEEADEWLEKIDFSAEYGFSYSDKKRAYKNGEISSAELVDILVNYEGKSREEALEEVAELDYEIEYPELSKTIGYSYYKKWEAEGKVYGVDFEVFTDVAIFRDDGSSKSATPQDEVWDYINSLNISDSQKDGLHLCFYKESTLKNTPWNK